jgi:F-type H+-transporting ATPase subunit b
MFTPEAMAGYVVAAIFTVINLIITYFVLKRFLFKPILSVLRKRRTTVENELSQAAEKLSAADSRLATADERLNNSNREAATILANAKAQAEIQSEAIVSEAKRESASLMTRADAEISRMRVSMLNDVRDEVADLSITIASKVIGQMIDEQRQHELVDQFLDKQIEQTLSGAENQGGEENRNA